MTYRISSWASLVWLHGRPPFCVTIYEGREYGPEYGPDDLVPTESPPAVYQRWHEIVRRWRDEPLRSAFERAAADAFVAQTC